MKGQMSWKEKMHLHELAEKKKSKEHAIRKAKMRREKEASEN